MAESILKLKVDSTEYDSKIKRAAQGLQAYAEGCRKVGGTLSVVEDETLDFVKSLGRMDTISKDTRGSINEMTKAFTELSVQYNKLTDEEKNSPFGKALAESITTLKGRIQDGNSELKNIGDSINNTGGFLGQLKEKFTINIDAIKLFSAGVAATSAALDVAKDAFFANEQSLDEWGRIVESSESIYKGFLDSLNTGDISGFLQRIGQITQAARDAYNALDDLNTYNAFNQINVEKTRTGMTESIVDYREGKGTKETVRAAGEAYKKELEERKKLEKEAYLKKVAEVAAQRGVSADDLTKALSGSYGSYQSLKNLPLSGTETVYYGGGMFGGGGSYEKAVPGSVQEKLGDALRRLKDTELKDLQALGAQAERTSNEIAQVDRQLVRVLNGRQGSGGGGGGSRGGRTSTPSIGDFDKILAKSLNANIKPEDIMGPSDAWTAYTGDIRSGLEGIDDELTNLTKFTKNFNPYNESMRKMAEVTKQQQEAFDLAAQSAANLGNALASIDDPGAKAAGTVLSAIANIALGFSQAAVTSSSLGPYGWIAYLAAGTAAMATTISTIHSLTGYANGGEIKGNSYSGDNLMAMGPDGGLIGLNAGEIVLNKAQQSTLAHNLQGNGGNGAGRIVGVLKGEDVVLMIDRWGMRTGRGELLFGKNL